MHAQLILWISLAASAAEAENAGVIAGVVVNATQGGVPNGSSEVVLRVRVDREFIPAANTMTDEQGKFFFANLPVDDGYLYLPGANRADVHYPGARVQLTRTQPCAAVKIEVYDAVTHPSPLVIKGQNIVIEPEAGALRVTESLLVRNPTLTTYVGQPASAGADPVTLTLAIPPDFERVTFLEEFFGRNFRVQGGKVVTGIPWTPGLREIRFTYILRNDQRQRSWQRPIDLPCERLTVHVRHDKPSEVTCNLDPSAEASQGEIVFASRAGLVPAGHVIHVELGRMPMAWTAHAKWFALAALATLIVAGTAVVFARPRRSPTVECSDASIPAHPLPSPELPAKSKRRTDRQRRRAA